jgi:arylsulfatase A-like enzyme
MDEAVGNILDALDEQNITEDTLVVFVSDNGGSQNTYACNGPLHGHKYTLAEGGIRVPMVMRWPTRIPAGKTHDALVASLDIAATCVQAGGGDAAGSLDGKSLLPLLEGASHEVVHNALFWDQGNEERPDWAVRVGPWKLHQAPGYGSTRTYCGDNSYGRATTQRNGLVFYDYPTPSGTLLYNLDDDPGERKNLAAEMPEKVAELTELYSSWRAEMEAPFNPRKLRQQEKPLPSRRSK